MRVQVGAAAPFELGAVETTPTIGITDYSRRVTDAFGVTRVVERAYSRRLSVRLVLASDSADEVQARLAELRATTALWTADDQIGWLAVEGFYKDFEVDHSVPPVSYCTLTVEGLAELAPAADPGGDPAPFGTVSSLRLVQPVAITSAMLVSSSVNENDYPVWLAGATYEAGARVISTATHRVYESFAGTNTGNDPAAGSDKWFEVGATNRWAMFDEALGSATSGAGPLSVGLAPGAIDALAILDAVGTSVRVQIGTYDQTKALSAGAATFLDLPLDGGQVTVTLLGSGTVSIGTLLVGRLRALGLTEASPTSGITDFSRKDRGPFGEVTLVERAWAKRMASKALLRTEAVDLVADRLAVVRARPALWLADGQRSSLSVYGFVKEWSIEVGETTSKLSLTVEGLSKAAPLAPTPVTVLTPAGDYDPASLNRPGYVVQFEGSSWVYVAAEASAGNAPPHLPDDENEWWRVLARAGRDGIDGEGLPGPAGQSIHIAYADSANGLINFTTGAANGRAYIGVYTDTNAGADSTDPADYGWTRLRGLDGEDGLDGPGGYVHLAYANSADGTVDFHLSDPTERMYLGVYTDQTLPDSADPATYSWSLIKGETGTAAVSVSVSPVAFQVQASSAGITKPGELPKTAQIKVLSGQADVTTAATFGAATFINCTGSVSAAGLVTLSSMSGAAESGSVTVPVTYGAANQDIVLPVAKIKEAAAGTGGGGGGSGAFNLVADNLHAVGSIKIAVTAGTLYFDGNIDSSNTSFGGSSELALYDSAGGFVAQIAYKTSPSNGYGSASFSKSIATGLAAGVWQQWSLQLAVNRAGGSGTADGSASGTWHQ